MLVRPCITAEEHALSVSLLAYARDGSSESLLVAVPAGLWAEDEPPPSVGVGYTIIPISLRLEVA